MRALVALVLALSSCGIGRSGPTRTERNRQLDELSALWSFYKYHYVRDGRVVALDEAGITTSEGQSYAMLRAVWSDDPWTFERVWNWTRDNLQVRGDHLFAWKWKDRVLDRHSATDADTDIALALVLASRRFSRPQYLEAARAILSDIWQKEVLRAGELHVIVAGDWALHEPYPTLHVAYLAPHAYQVFAGIDPQHPWQKLVSGSYALLHWLYFDRGVRAPPEVVYVDRRRGAFLLARPGSTPSSYGYDSVPLFWRIAADEAWFGRGENKLHRKMLEFFEQEWRDHAKILDRYSTDGRPLSTLEGLPHMAAVHALANVESPDLADSLRPQKLDRMWESALAGIGTPYYLHNWLWFDRALELKVVRHFDEFLGFLRPFDFATFQSQFPWALFGATVLLALFASRRRAARVAFVAGAGAIAARYLVWRAGQTLNFYEGPGPFISIALLAAEAYSFSTVMLLVLQVGTRGRARRVRPSMPEPAPSVDVFIPIYSESLEILDKTLTAAAAMQYPNKRIHVCDDSHRAEVARLAAEHGANYIRGPKRHAKAGNLNNAMALTNGELIVVFDTDHVPVRSFLEETIPWFGDGQVGFVQTPHHFYNQDIFQRALRARPAIPNEQDMFNHAIQGGRDAWGGSFFVGSGAVFRRKAMEQLGGFLLLSITEDIHTSQHLHAKGWRSVFVDKDLAVGLTAENLAGYLVQRRRWMLGCLQIFFKDNPLFCRGLGLRHRLGYFASLWYFFFPIARVVFWITPLYFLLFHLHPLFADVSVLLAYVVPYLVVLPLVTRVLLPGWPRFIWGTLYETVVSFPLARAMLDLFLPARLAFKVTPKGVLSDRRRFDLRSSAFLLIAAAITLIAVCKGVLEFFYFGIEKDAYFINLAWALANLVELAVALLIAWERPQRRSEERIARPLLIGVRTRDAYFEAHANDVSLSGVSFTLDRERELRFDADLTFLHHGLTVSGRLVYNERGRCAFRFVDMGVHAQRELVRILYTDPDAWSSAHDSRTRRSSAIALWLVLGVVRSLFALRPRRRMHTREKRLRRFRCVVAGQGCTLWLRDENERGMGFLIFGVPPPQRQRLALLVPFGPVQWVRVVHCTRKLPGVWRLGVERIAAPAEERIPDAYLAA